MDSQAEAEEFSQLVKGAMAEVGLVVQWYDFGRQRFYYESVPDDHDRHDETCDYCNACDKALRLASSVIEGTTVIEDPDNPHDFVVRHE